MIGVLAEYPHESVEHVKVKRRLQDFPMQLPFVDLQRDETLADEIVEQPVEAYLTRVLHAAEHHLNVLRLHEHDIRQERQPYP